MPVHYEVEGAIGIFTVENGKVNVFDPPMHRALFEALEGFERDPAVKVGLLRAAGTRAFSAGDDLKFPQAEQSVEQRLERHFYPLADGNDPGYPGWDRSVMAMRRFKPVVAAVNGWCLGRGLMYLLHLSDLRIAGRGARFGMPEIRYGMGGAGAMSLIHRHLPRTVALRLVLTGEPIDAAEALRVNLVNEVVDDGEVEATARALAAQIARHPQSAIRTEMEAYGRVEDLDRESALAFAEHLYRLQRLAATTPNDAIDFKAT